MSGINTLLVGESKSGKTMSFETLPRGVLIFSFDIGGWHALARTRDKREVGKEEESCWLTGMGRPLTVIKSFKSWLEQNGRTLLPKEILVVDQVVADPIALGQYTTFDAVLMTSFIWDHIQLWSMQKECIERGICHICIDSLTSMQRPIMEYIKAMNARMITVVQDWLQAIDKVDEIVQSSVALPFDFIMTGHTQVEKDEASGRVRENLLIYGKSLPNLLLAKFDDILLSIAQRVSTGMSFVWGTNRSGPLQVWIPKGMEKDSPAAQSWPYEGIPIGTRNFSNLPPRIEQNFEKLYGDKLFGG